MAETKSGLGFHFKVKLTDGQVLDIQSIPFDTIRYERKYKSKFSEGQGSAEMLCWIAYTAGARMGLINDSTFDAWIAKVADWELIDDDEDEKTGDPTPADSPTEESES